MADYDDVDELAEEIDETLKLEADVAEATRQEQEQAAMAQLMPDTASDPSADVAALARKLGNICITALTETGVLVGPAAPTTVEATEGDDAPDFAADLRNFIDAASLNEVYRSATQATIDFTQQQGELMRANRVSEQKLHNLGNWFAAAEMFLISLKGRNWKHLLKTSTKLRYGMQAVAVVKVRHLQEWFTVAEQILAGFASENYGCDDWKTLLSEQARQTWMK
jgi:hypothetical protein